MDPLSLMIIIRVVEQVATLAPVLWNPTPLAVLARLESRGGDIRSVLFVPILLMVVSLRLPLQCPSM